MTAARLAAWIRGHDWVLNLVFMALGSYFVAGAANAFVARSIRVIPTAEDVPSAGRGAQRSMSLGGEIELSSMAERNLMGLKREDLNPPPVAPAAEPTLGAFDENSLRPC